MFILFIIIFFVAVANSSLFTLYSSLFYFYIRWGLVFTPVYYLAGKPYVVGSETDVIYVVVVGQPFRQFFARPRQFHLVQLYRGRVAVGIVLVGHQRPCDSTSFSLLTAVVVIAGAVALEGHRVREAQHGPVV